MKTTIESSYELATTEKDSVGNPTKSKRKFDEEENRGFFTRVLSSMRSCYRRLSGRNDVRETLSPIQQVQETPSTDEDKGLKDKRGEEVKKRKKIEDRTTDAGEIEDRYGSTILLSTAPKQEKRDGEQRVSLQEIEAEVHPTENDRQVIEFSPQSQTIPAVPTTSRGTAENDRQVVAFTPVELPVDMLTEGNKTLGQVAFVTGSSQVAFVLESVDAKVIVKLRVNDVNLSFTTTTETEV